MCENTKCKSINYGFHSFNIAHMPEMIYTLAIDHVDDY
jgi:hypothetical protein